jgi:hypothetical protein
MQAAVWYRTRYNSAYIVKFQRNVVLEWKCGFIEMTSAIKTVL